MDEGARSRIETSRRTSGTAARAAHLAVAGSVVAAALGGCIYSKEKERVAAPPQPVVVMAPPAERVVTSPAGRVVTSAEGRWQLYGDGTSSAPYYWAWIPAGANPPAPPPPGIR
jgi:hypothetical protein